MISPRGVYFSFITTPYFVYVDHTLFCLLFHSPSLFEMFSFCFVPQYTFISPLFSVKEEGGNVVSCYDNDCCILLCVCCVFAMYEKFLTYNSLLLLSYTLTLKLDQETAYILRVLYSCVYCTRYSLGWVQVTGVSSANRNPTRFWLRDSL